MDVIIIGAGASGLTAGITAALNGAKVTILEHENKPGKKILTTGNGKCNITNKILDVDKYYGNEKFINDVLDSFGFEDTINYFNQLGIVTKDKNNYIYPASEQASTVLNTLRDKAIDLGVSIKTNNEIKNIEKTSDGFCIDIGIKLNCQKLIIATGGMSFPKTGSRGDGYTIAKKFGHRIIEPKPALTALICENNTLFKASGVRTQATVKVTDESGVEHQHSGELQITDYGISGILVFNISRLTNKGSRIYIDFMPNYEKEELINILTKSFKARKHMTIPGGLNGLLNDKLSSVILEALKIDKNTKSQDITMNQILEIANILKKYTVTVKNRKGFDFAQVTAGGVDTVEIDSKTMMSKIVPNLYFTGEIINVDGICGGYNLQFAWATGAIAGGNCF